MTLIGLSLMSVSVGEAASYLKLCQWIAAKLIDH